VVAPQGRLGSDHRVENRRTVCTFSLFAVFTANLQPSRNERPAHEHAGGWFAARCMMPVGSTLKTIVRSS
jgi:hypothetical protein